MYMTLCKGVVLITLVFHQNVVFEEGELGQGVFFGKDPFVDLFLFFFFLCLLFCFAVGFFLLMIFIPGMFCHCILVVVSFGGSNTFAVLLSPRESPLINLFC